METNKSINSIIQHNEPIPDKDIIKVCVLTDNNITRTIVFQGSEKHIDNDSDIFREIEEYVVEQYDEMDNNRPTDKCGNCNNEVFNQVFCCRSCSLEYYA